MMKKKKKKKKMMMMMLMLTHGTAGTQRMVQDESFFVAQLRFVPTSALS